MPHGTSRFWATTPATRGSTLVGSGDGEGRGVGDVRVGLGAALDESALGLGVVGGVGVVAAGGACTVGAVQPVTAPAAAAADRPRNARRDVTLRFSPSQSSSTADG